MNKVVTINLNGNAYQVDEPGYDAMRTYLDQAAAKLTNNPDKAEIMADFEQAIAERCNDYITTNKNVVTAQEVQKIIDAMGPVENETSAMAAAEPTLNQPRRLYKIREGSMIDGVCTGLAAYFGIDVTVVRIIFVLLTVLGGSGVLIYLILMFVIPEAKTPQEKAQARGVQVTAQDVLAQAKAKYNELTDEKHWERVAKYQESNWPQVARTIERIFQVVARALGIVFFVAGALITAAWVMALWLFVVRENAIGFGQEQPILMTVWLTSGYYTAFLPLTAIGSALSKYGRNKAYTPHAIGQFLGILVFVIALSAFLTIGIDNKDALRDTINKNQNTVFISEKNEICIKTSGSCNSQ